MKHLLSEIMSMNKQTEKQETDYFDRNSCLAVSSLWNSNIETDWTNAEKHYMELISLKLMDLEKEIDNLNPESIKQMSVYDFYNFLYNRYFVWKYTAPNRLATTRKSLEKYKVLDEM